MLMNIAISRIVPVFIVIDIEGVILQPTDLRVRTDYVTLVVDAASDIGHIVVVDD